MISESETVIRKQLNFAYKAFSSKLMLHVLLVYNSKSKSLCIHSILYVFCIICVHHNIVFVLSNILIKLFFENYFACIPSIYYIYRLLTVYIYGLIYTDCVRILAHIHGLCSYDSGEIGSWN